MNRNTGHRSQIEALSLETSCLESFGDRLNLGIAVLTQDLSFSFFNDRAREFLHLQSLDFKNFERIEDLFRLLAARGDWGTGDPEKMMRERMNELSRFIVGQDIQEVPTQITPPNGRTIEILKHRAANGTITYTVEDISAAQKKDEALSIALEMGKAGYYSYNFDTREVAIFSSYLWSILTPEEKKSVKEKTLTPLVHPEDSDKSTSFWRKLKDRAETADSTIRIQTSRHGIRWFRFHARPQFSDTRRMFGVICFFEDVTENLALENDLRNARDQAQGTLQAQNNFLARLSHEIRTPMNAVIGLTDSLVQGAADPSMTSKLELIQSSADSIMNILEGTLSHTKLDADKLMLNPTLGNPRETVKTICKLWEMQGKKNGTTIRCHIDEKAPEKIGFDRFRYEQCLNNLLSNAVKFTPQGRVDVILTMVGEDTSNPRLVLAVKDTGIGMTPAQQSRIFEAFTQADKTISSRFGGTGLGMNITKTIIEMMGGTISVKSVIGEGTVFALVLPVNVHVEPEQTAENTLFDQILESNPEPNMGSHAPAKDRTIAVTASSISPQKIVAADNSDADDPQPYSSLKILVADDNATNHLVVESLLENVVGTIYKAENGQEVLDILDVQDIDIVLMDIHMPIMDGIESTLAIRRSEKHWSDILIIAVTADPQYQQLRLCKNIGMDDSLAKPVKLSGLLEAFDRVLSIDRKNAPYKEMYKKAV